MIRDIMSHPRELNQIVSSLPSLKLCASSEFFRGFSKPWFNHSVRHHRQKHKAVSSGLTIHEFFIFSSSDSTSDSQGERAVRYWKNWIHFEGIFRLYACFIWAMNLQSMRKHFRKCWSFSVTTYMATHMVIWYFDTHILNCLKSVVRDFVS